LETEDELLPSCFGFENHQRPDSYKKEMKQAQTTSSKPPSVCLTPVCWMFCAPCMFTVKQRWNLNRAELAVWHKTAGLAVTLPTWVVISCPTHLIKLSSTLKVASRTTWTVTSLRRGGD
jgi:hypothetical protein